MSSGLSGGKVERASQNLQKVDHCNVISIDRNSFPISSTTNLTGRINPRTTLVCLEQPTLAGSKNRYNVNRINLDMTELQQLHHILGVLLNLAGYQSTPDQQT